MAKQASLLLLALLSVGACHRPPRAMPDRAAARSVFTDSAYHAAMCEVPRAAESWRTSCQPKDQRLDRSFYVRPPR